MKYHQQNPRTRNPSIFLNLDEEEVMQLRAALATIVREGTLNKLTDDNQRAVVNDLNGHLRHAFLNAFTSKRGL